MLVSQMKISVTLLLHTDKYGKYLAAYLSGGNFSFISRTRRTNVDGRSPESKNFADIRTFDEHIQRIRQERRQ